MLIVILVDAQYLQNVVFSFEKGLNGQNHFSSGFHQPIKKSPHRICDSCFPPLKGNSQTLNAIWKSLCSVSKEYNIPIRTERKPLYNKRLTINESKHTISPSLSV